MSLYSSLRPLFGSRQCFFSLLLMRDTRFSAIARSLRRSDDGTFVEKKITSKIIKLLGRKFLVLRLRINKSLQNKYAGRRQ